MKWLNFFKKEKRQTLEEALLSAGVLTTDITMEQALAIPAVCACVELISTTIASLPIVLYKQTGKEGNEVELVDEDKRIALLNDDSGDTLDGFQLKRAFIEDYLLLGAGYGYINRNRNDVKSIHYVQNQHLTVTMNVDPIFKRYEILVNGAPYRDFEFIKLVRKTKNGVTGYGVLEENNKMLSIVYNTMIFEENIVTTGGNKKGFLKANTRMSAEAMAELKRAWKDLYRNNTESVLILNNGLEFQESSQTAVELQMNEHKTSNSAEICKMFLVPPQILSGQANDTEYSNWIKMCISPILTAFETALNKDLLLPSEKDSFYFAFDTSELTRGDIEKRFNAYQIGVSSGILQIDEVRYKENLPPLGLKFLKMGLQDVLYFPDSEEIYTPNTNKLAKMGENPDNGTGTGEIQPNNISQPPDNQNSANEVI